MTSSDVAQPLRDFEPQHKFFVGIDSDGCVFDTMDIKQSECFCPWTISYFKLQPVAQAVRECKNFTDLYSRTRGVNRHKATKRILAELLPEHPLVKARGFNVPKLPHYFAWVDNPKSVLSNEGLKKAIAEAADPQAKSELQLALDWSLRVNAVIGEIVKDMPPFPYVRESLEKMSAKADLIVVSQTPGEALVREWQEHKVDNYVEIIAGQEMGTKSEHIKIATKNRYAPGHVLMIGDALGDLKAAKDNNALFYPINPGNEDKSWKRFHDEAFDKFIAGQYAGAYEAKLIAEFDEYLPECPPWKK
jgi:phosphoglycolate phosphatase-like HAD superfamily hydrolase